MNKSKQNYKDKTFQLKIAVVCVGASFLFFSVACAFKNLYTGVVSMLVLGAFFTLIPGLMLAYYTSTLNKVDILLKSANEDLKAARNSLSKFDINIIPPAYRDKQIIIFIYDALINQRAMTMQEAVNLYEQEMRYNRMEALQKISAQASLLSAELANASLKYRL